MGTTVNLHNTAIHDQKSSILYRFEVPSNRQLVVLSAGVSDKQGNTYDDVEIQVYDQDDGNPEFSTSDDYEEPASAVLNLGGHDVIIRVQNDDGTTRWMNGFLEFEVS